MRLRTTVSGLALSAGLALTLAPTGLANAVTEDGATAKLARHSAATTKAEQQRVENYWTPWRMKNATPMGAKVDSKAAKKPPAGSSAVQETPQPRLGKVFFTLGGVNYVCSGTATNSSNGDVVTTAGHCLNEGPGAFATNFAFVPAYDNGAAPYGTWTAQNLFTTSAWANSGDFDYDVGFAVMNENTSGQSLTQVVGSYPIAFNLARGLTYKAYGYPAAKPFNGQTLWSCSGAVMQDTYGGSQDQGLPCNMTGGSSGGGWITSGSLNSVNSFGYTGVRNVMWGPYFGSTIQSVYNAASVN
jgi:V8-like Glu-specific endopeptidase